MEFIELNENLVLKWEKVKFSEGLTYAWNNGTTDIKAEVAESWGKLACRSSLADLKESISSPFMNLSLASVKAYISICSAHDLAISSVMQQSIQQTLKKWEEHVAEMKSKGVYTYKFNLVFEASSQPDAQFPNLGL